MLVVLAQSARTLSPALCGTLMCKNADRLFVNVKERDADVLFKVCTSVVLAERWDVHII